MNQEANRTNELGDSEQFAACQPVTQFYQNSPTTKAFKIYLKRMLIAKAFYSLWLMTGKTQNPLTDKEARSVNFNE